MLYENFRMRIDKDGGRHYHGSTIRRKEFPCSFTDAPTRDTGGRHRLVAPAEMVGIEAQNEGGHCLVLWGGGCLFPLGDCLGEAS